VAVNGLRRFAAAGPVPVYPVIGSHALSAVEDLALSAGISLKTSPRHASLLLVAGEIRAEDRGELRRLHDQLPHPRATVWWRAAVDPDFERPVIVGADEDPAAALAGTYRQLLAADRVSENHLLPDEPPAPRHGSAAPGEDGMAGMGGKPFGRAMAMTGDDLRDGLALDAFSVTLGPFLPMLPPGLLLDVTLQGDVIQVAKVRRVPFSQNPDGAGTDPLRCIARLLRALGLSAPADRFIRSAFERARGGAPAIGPLRRSLYWSGALKAVPARLGELAPASPPVQTPDGGVAARGRDVRGRLIAWWDAAARELEGGVGHSDGRVRATDERLAGTRLDDLLVGLEWSEAVLLINSFEIETLRRLCPEAGTAGDRVGEAH
jgi:hypothetical protein